MLIYNYGWLYIILIIFWLFIKNFMSYWLRLLKADILRLIINVLIFVNQFRVIICLLMINHIGGKYNFAINYLC